MINGIPGTQNETRNLRRLAAQKQLYSEAKNVQGLQILVSTPAVIVWSVVALFVPAVKVYAALWACLATLADVLFFSPLIKAKKASAAKIQEEFDCEVLDLPWSDCKLGEHPEPELVSNYRRQAERDRELTAFRDWYPILAGEVPLHIGRLICQRSSCWWDRTLREKYSRASLAILLAGMVVIVVLAMLSGATVSNLIVAVLLLQPSIILAVKAYREHVDAASNADRLRRSAEMLWRRSVSGQLASEESRHEARLLQNEIYDHRAKSPLVFDWLYKRMRAGTETQMLDGAAELVEEYKRLRPQSMPSSENPGEM